MGSIAGKLSRAVLMSIWKCFFFNWRMCLDMLNSSIFQNEYLLLINGLYESLDRALFIHRLYWEKHPQRAELHCIPVIPTPLYPQT